MVRQGRAVRDLQLAAHQLPVEAEVEVNSCSGRGIATSLVHGVEDGLATQLGSQYGSQTALVRDVRETRRSGRQTGRSVVIVAGGNEAHAMALVENLAGRDARLPDVQRIVGSFADTLPITARLQDGQSLAELAACLSPELAGAMRAATRMVRSPSTSAISRWGVCQPRCTSATSPTLTSE